MKLTAELKRWVVKTVREYCKKMKLKPPYIVVEMFHNTKIEDYERMGMYYGDQVDILFVNVRAHMDKLHLRHTIVHELTHKKHINWRHGQKFNLAVENVLGKKITTA